MFATAAFYGVGYLLQLCVCYDVQVVYIVSALLWQPPSGGDDDTR